MNQTETLIWILPITANHKNIKKNGDTFCVWPVIAEQSILEPFFSFLRSLLQNRSHRKCRCYLLPPESLFWSPHFHTLTTPQRLTVALTAYFLFFGPFKHRMCLLLRSSSSFGLAKTQRSSPFLLLCPRQTSEKASTSQSLNESWCLLRSLHVFLSLCS